ncbi:MAG: hypothetical protein K0S65_1529, partial [Labilithrix sp.]|nr:hypothetical protein [Labilithrix sp.]
MLIFGSGLSGGSTAYGAAREAAAEALHAFGETRPKLAIVFASVTYDDVARVPGAIREIIPGIAIVGGSSGGCVIGPRGIASYGISIVLLGGDDIEVETRAARLGGPELVDVVPAAQEIAQAADVAAKNGLQHYACLVFGPGLIVDGEALVAAVRKGAGARAQLAGGLTGDDLTLDRPLVFVDGELRDDTIVLAGVFTRKAMGIAARHGCRPVGPLRTVTRADGDVLHELDGRPALEVWLEDARSAGATLPTDPKDLALYLANYFEIGIADAPPKGKERGELVARAPFKVGDQGTVKLSASIGEGRRVQVMHASRKDLLRASASAAADAVMRTRGQVAGGLILACTGRLASLGEEFKEEAALLRNRLAAPIGGACVFGEIAKSER